ncbi:MAG: DnaA/Hda family protein [Desulfomicrobium sp.]|nr:DnaA/Hda family protein [Desulfomicrobium sp.]NLV97673.1 chromosomal replication initiator DnaA [Desulfovibrionales bacterium]
MNTDHIYKALQHSFSVTELDRWYPSLDLTIQNKVLHVCFPHRYFEDWFALHARQNFEQALAETVSRIEYTCRTDGLKQPAQRKFHQKPTFPFGAEFVFDNFLVNEKNFFPVASAQQVADNKEIQYNPLVLCGQSGSGKSFLLRAIANSKSAQIQSGVFVIGMEDLHQLYATRGDARTYLLSMQFLAVDDLQDIVKYPYLQDELITLFDHYHGYGKQMVFGCADTMGKLNVFTPKLKFRLEWGLIVHLKAPDLDIRSQFIQVKCQERGLELSKNRILYLAQRCSDLRNLEGCLHRLSAYQELVQDQISDADFNFIFSSLDARPAVPVTIDRIMDTVCDQFSLTKEELISTSRKQKHVFARQIAMYLCRKLLGLSFPELGRVFGGKDHSTALYSYRKVEQLRNTDKNVKIMLQTLSDTCLRMNKIRGA